MSGKLFLYEWCSMMSAVATAFWANDNSDFASGDAQCRRLRHPVLEMHNRSAMTCADLMNRRFPRQFITTALRSAGTFTPPGPPPLTNLPAFCRVALTVAPQINIEVWMPKDTWNGRYRVKGRRLRGLDLLLRTAPEFVLEYADCSTDTGHPASAGGTFALNPDGTLNSQLILDLRPAFAPRDGAKSEALINALLWNCSEILILERCLNRWPTGIDGCAALPEEYDGLVIAAPAINWDRFIPSELCHKS